VQDDDVLDTWFSSGLWPMSTLGWPEETADFALYYPTSLLLTGFDIIFFWVARMMMFGLEFTDKVPFKDVYITPLVRDELGKKMTKSKGNVVDPLDLMNQYGADAVRFTLAQLAAQGRDVILSHDRFAASRAFANKIWNAARFVMMNLEGAPQPLPKVEIAKLGLAERWILSRLDTTIREVSGSIDVFEFNVAAMKLYDFIWHEFCDWYIELSKEPLKAGGERQAGARWVLINVFDKMLRVLHPFMPFVSEEIWQVIRPYLDEENLAPHLPIAEYPEPSATNPLSTEEATAMNHCIEATEAINSLRSLLGWQPGQRVVAKINSKASDVPLWTEYATVLAKLASLESFNYDGTQYKVPGVVFDHLSWTDVGIEVAPGFDYGRTREKLLRELDEAQKHAGQHEKRLNDEGFREKADPETQEEVKRRFLELTSRSFRLEQQLKQLDGFA
jgi:valyl-tRNA synthetase